MNQWLDLITNGKSQEVADCLTAIRQYTNMSFATPYGIRKQPIDILANGKVQLHSTATSTVDFRILFKNGNCIEFLGSLNNPSIYFVDEVTQNDLTLYNPERIVPETVYCSIVNLFFHGITHQDILSMIEYKSTMAKVGSVKKESLDGYSYEMQGVTPYDNKGGYPTTIMNSFNSLRRLPKQRQREYVLYGYLNS